MTTPTTDYHAGIGSRYKCNRDLMVIRNGQVLHFDPCLQNLAVEIGCLKSEFGVHPGSISKQFESYTNPIVTDPGLPISVPCLGLQEVVESYFATRVISEFSIISLPRPSNLEHLACPQVAEFVCDHHLGLIRMENAQCSARLIVDLVLAFPGQRILIVGAKIAALNEMANTVGVVLGKVDQSMCGTPPVYSDRYPFTADGGAEIPKLAFSTYVQTAELELPHCDIVVIPEASECSHERFQLAMSQVDARFRLYGLLDSQSLGANDKFLKGKLFATFGPNILDVASNGQPRRSAELASVCFFGDRSSVKAKEFDLTHQQHYTENHKRNYLLFNIAEGLATGNRDQVNKYPDIRKWLNKVGTREFAVTVVVKTIAHAIELKRFLKDWPVVGQLPANINASEKKLQLLNRVPNQLTTGAKQIVLAQDAEQFIGNTSDVVIWASGDTEPSIPNSWFHGSDHQAKPLLVVDFFDRFHKLAKKNSNARRSWYLDRGIACVGLEVVDERCREFIKKYVRKTA